MKRILLLTIILSHCIIISGITDTLDNSNKEIIVDVTNIAEFENATYSIKSIDESWNVPKIRIADIRFTPVNGDTISLQEVPYWQHGSTGEPWGLDAPKTTQITAGEEGCAWVIGTPTGCPYGDPTVCSFADLSGFDQLLITYTEGTPRVLMNRDLDYGQWNTNEAESHLIDNTHGGWSSKYFSTKTGKNVGETVLVVDLIQLVNDKGYAYLHAIKGANWQNVLVTNMVLYKIEEKDSLEETIEKSDWTTLKQLYREWNGNEWTRRWKVSEEPSSVKDFPGVMIEEGKVVEINLSNNNMEGTFPYILLSLPKLRKLDVSGNRFSDDLSTSATFFAQQNPSVVSNVWDINISNNKFSGNIGLFANSFPSLTRLNASNNYLEDVVPMISPNVTSLDLSRQETNRVVEVNLSDTAQTWLSKIPTILTYQHEQQTYGPITDANIYCSTIDGDWGFLVIFNVMGLPERKEYYGQSGDTLRVVVLDNIFELQGSSFFVKLNFDQGDSNFDGQVNVLDLQTTINYMFQGYDNLFNYTAANLWKDEIINVQDIICMVNLLMNNETGETGQAASLRRNVPASESVDNAKVYVQNRQLMIDTSEPVSAFDIIISGGNYMNVVQSLKQAGMTISTNTTSDGIHIIGYSLNGACIPAGTTVIGMLDQTASVRNAILSDKEARAIGVTYDGNATGINTIDLTKRKTSDVYDLQGRKVNSIQRKGIYIENGHKMIK